MLLHLPHLNLCTTEPLPLVLGEPVSSMYLVVEHISTRQLILVHISAHAYVRTYMYVVSRFRNVISHAQFP